MCRPTRQISRAILIWTLASISLSIAFDLRSRVSLPAPRIHVRWTSGLDDVERVALERKFHLADGEFLEQRTWAYRLTDHGRANVAALVEERRVEDTYGIDRHSLQVDGAPGLLDGLPTALLLGFASSTLALVIVMNRRRIVAAAAGTIALLRTILTGLPARESRLTSATALAAVLAIATIVKLPSWAAVAWDEEELWMSILTTSMQARYWSQGTWLPLWNPFQGFGVPHPYVTHLIYAPLFPLMLVFRGGTALSLHYSITTAIGVGSLFLLSRRLGASPFLAAAGALTWLSSSFVTQLLFVDFWTQAFTFANFAPALVVLVLDYFDANRTRGTIQDALALGLVAGIVLNCTTPAGSVPLAVPLAVIAAVCLRTTGSARLVWLVLAFLIAVAMYAPSLVELWREMGRFTAVRLHTMTTFSPDIVSTALLSPIGGSLRAFGLGAPFVVAASLALVRGLRPRGAARLPTAWRAMAAAAAICLVLYLLPSGAFSIASGNGEWGQLLTIFAIPLAAAQVTTWYRNGGRGLKYLTWAVVVTQLALVGYWSVRWWRFQSRKDPTQSVGVVLNQPSALERALLERVRPDRDRVLLSPLSEEFLLRKVDYGHASNLPRLGIPLVNGLFKFVSYGSVYPDPDVTWGLITTHDEVLRPEILDVAGIRFLVTSEDEVPADRSMRLVGRYEGHGSRSFQVWENLDVWPRISFVDGAVAQQPDSEAGVILWRRRLLPSRLPDAVTYDMTRPGRYSIRVESAQTDRYLLISDVVRTDLLTVRGARVVQSGPLADIFTVLKIPAGTQSIDVTWESPLLRWLWMISYLTFGLGLFAYVVAKVRDRKAPVPVDAYAS